MSQPHHTQYKIKFSFKIYEGFHEKVGVIIRSTSKWDGLFGRLKSLGSLFATMP